MKKSTKITIVLAGIILLASLILILVVFLPKLQHEEKEASLSEEFKTMVIEYYEQEFKTLMPNYLEQTGSLTVTLDSLQGMNKDISSFEKYSCDYNNTYAEIKKDGDSYSVDVHLDCEI